MKIFLDTNILLDLLSEERRGHAEALLILSENLDFFAVADSILTCKYVMRKGDNLEVLDSLSALLQIIIFEDTKVETIKDTINICRTHNLSDLEDIAKLLLAMDLGSDMFITNDLELIKNNPIKELAVLQPFELLDALGFEKDLLGNWLNTMSIEYKINAMTSREVVEALMDDKYINYRDLLKDRYEVVGGLGMVSEGSPKNLFGE